MRCTDVERFVDSFIDRELAEPDRLEFETHLTSCAFCRRLVQEQASFKATLRALAPRPEAPEALKRRIAAALDAEDRAAPRPPSFGRLARAAGPALALGVAMLIAAPRLWPARESPVVLDSIVKHQRNLPLEITGAPEVVRSWFDGKVPFAVRAPRLEPMASLRGGRLVSLGNREAAYLIYEVMGGEPGLHRVSVFVFDARDLALGAPRRQRVGGHEVFLDGTRGYHVALFRDNDVGYAITGTLDEADLLRLVSAMGSR